MDLDLHLDLDLKSELWLWVVVERKKIGKYRSRREVGVGWRCIFGDGKTESTEAGMSTVVREMDEGIVGACTQ